MSASIWNHQPSCHIGIGSWPKEYSTPWVRDAQVPRLQAWCLETIPMWKIKAFAVQRSLEPKWHAKITQNPFPRGPNGFQNPSWRPPGKPSWEEVVFKGVEDASRTSFGRPCGSPKSFQTRPGSVSKTHVTSNSVLERFWNPLETDFECFFEVSAWWDDKQKRQEWRRENLQKHLCFHSRIASSHC